jgi:uncharacterized membrane protein
MSTPSVRRTERLLIWALLLGIFAIGMALRLHDIDADSLWGDEINTAIWSQLDLPSLVAAIGERDDPPLLYIVTRLFLAAFGHSEFVLRLPAVLFGSLSIPLAYKLGRTLWASQEGLLGAFLLAVNAYHIRYSQEARHYSLMVFLALLSLIFLLKALERNQGRLWIAFALSTSLSLYNHAFAFLFLAAEVLYAACVLSQNWLLKRQRDITMQGHSSQFAHSPARQALMLVASLALVALSYLPWLSIFWDQVSRHTQSTAAVSAAGPQLSLAFLREVFMSYSAGVGTGHLWLESVSLRGVLDPLAFDISLWQGVVLLLSLALFLWGLASCGGKTLLLMVLWLGAPFAVLSFVATKRFVHARYVLYILPLYLLLIARGTARLTRIQGRRLGVGEADRKSLLLLTIAPALLFGLISLDSVARYYASQKDDWRGVAWYLKDSLASGDVILADGKAYRPYGDDGKVGKALSYYLESRGSSEAPVVPVRRTIWRDLKSTQHSDGNVWAVLWYPGELPRADPVTVVGFHDVPVIRLRDPSGDVLHDTISMLEALLHLLPGPDAHFDVHLALTEVYLRTGRFEQAELELESATDVKPDHPIASRELATTRAEYERVSALVQDMQSPLWRNLGDVVAFLGYIVESEHVRPGETTEVTLWWQALGEMDRDFSVFIHIVDHADRIWAQYDALLVHGDDPTSTWLPGDRVRGKHNLQLPPDTPPGVYTIKTGIYYWQTGERLPVWDEDGRRLAEDVIVLDCITVTR